MADDLDTFDPVRGPARELIDAQELSQPQDRVSVIFDRRRRQPRYFDDRFLTARDLTRSQQYTLLRQADLAQLSGPGIVHGLNVTSNGNGTVVAVDPGLGIARSGESVTVRERLDIPVAKLRVAARHAHSHALIAVDAATSAQAGLFMLTAFPVEHARTKGLTFPSGNPTPQLADTEIAESTWFALVPVPNVDPKEVNGRGRARLAREVFVGGFDPTAITDGLGLALVGIAGGRVQWIDQALIARDVGGDAVLGLGLKRRKLRLAFQDQYTQHLAVEVQRRRVAGLADGLAAVEAFDALPPVGPLPRGAVQVTTTEVRQSFLPREIYVEMAIVPDDEVPALLAEGLLATPIDLTLPPATLEGVPVLIVVPVPRSGYDQQTPRMAGAYRGPKIALTGRPLVRVRPIDALAVLRGKNEAPVIADPVPLDLEAWRKAVESAPQLWYIRRQQFSSTSIIVPRTPAGRPGDPDPLESLESEVARERIKAAAEIARFNHLFDISSPRVIGEMNDLLGNQLTDKASETIVHVSGMLGELAYMARRPRLTVVEAVDPPPSPVFVKQATSSNLTLRPLEVDDVKRVTTRYSVAGVTKLLSHPAWADPVVRSVLATSAVLPELAIWASTTKSVVLSPSGGSSAAVARVGVEFKRIAAGAKAPISKAVISAASPISPVDHIASLAKAGKLAELRDLARTIQLASFVIETPPIIIRLPLDKANSLEVMKKSGELDSLAAVWTAADVDVLGRLDEILTKRSFGDQPLFASATLMRLLTLGFELPTRTDAEVQALLTALTGVFDNKGKFAAPNGNRGEILAMKEHRERDALLRAATEVSPKIVVMAQKQLATAGFVKPEVALETSVLAHRLLSLASDSFAHFDVIASAKPEPLAAFVKAAATAIKTSSVARMRRALQSLTDASIGGPTKGKSSSGGK